MEGKKTYVMILGGVFAVLAYSQGLYDREVLEMLLALFGLGSIATLRHGLAKK